MFDGNRGSSTWLIAAVPALAIAQVLAGSLHDLTGLGVSIPDRSAANDTPAVPAVYAFAVWGLIFLWSAAFAVYQALPRQRDNPLLARLRGPAALAFALNATWEIHAQLGSLAWTSFAIIFALVMPLLVVVERVRKFDAPIGQADLWLAVVPLHILAGWISVANFASLSTTLDVVGRLDSGAAALWRDVVLVLAAGMVGALVARRARVPAPYALTICWGLAGIVAKNVPTGSQAVAIAASIAMLLVIGAIVPALRNARRRRDRSAVPA